MAVAFAVLSVCVGLPSLIIFLAGPWYPSSSNLERSTIGNFGLVSNNSGSNLIQSLLVNDASVDTSGLSIGGFGSSKSERGQGDNKEAEQEYEVLCHT